ncbi:hypothetical protein WMF13_01095 [Sorangium sp. So ce513]
MPRVERASLPGTRISARRNHGVRQLATCGTWSSTRRRIWLVGQQDLHRIVEALPEGDLLAYGQINGREVVLFIAKEARGKKMGVGGLEAGVVPGPQPMKNWGIR